MTTLHTPESGSITRLRESDVAGVAVSDRVRAIRAKISATQPALCAERALLVTRFVKARKSESEPTVLLRAAVLRDLLRKKRVRIYDRELLVGCYTSHRVGGGLFPELHGLAMLEDLFRFERRPVNPIKVASADRRNLLREVIPYWLTRILAFKAFSTLREKARVLRDQLKPTFYLMNELGGISHFIPEYARLLELGTSGYRELIRDRLDEVPENSRAARFLHALEIVCDALEVFAEGYRNEALRQATQESDKTRRSELEQIADVCARVPLHPAETFQEALQSVLFAQIALNLESLDNSVCPGRLDQVLWPYYRADIESGRLSRDDAFELLGCFALKLCEIVPIFSQRVTRFHGGLFNGQVVAVGGTDENGADATNELTYLFVELMDKLRTRQPNYSARLHPGSPERLKKRIASALADGAVSPALYNDEVIVDLLRQRGFAAEDARNYANVGCVEPTPAGCSYLSTDAALVNLPLCLELALNRGKRFGSRRRLGAKTADPTTCNCIDDLIDLYDQQVAFVVKRLCSDLRAVELANAKHHPTPLTSMLIRGCIESGRDASRGGAIYNGSGVQGVGVVEVGNALAALDSVVFQQGSSNVARVVAACKSDFNGDDLLHARLAAVPKYGNDVAAVDGFVSRVMTLFSDHFEGQNNSRGGRFVAGFYSVTSHQGFGEIVGALPSGRKANAPFSSGISPSNGTDLAGPTAVLQSQANLPLARAKNGVNLNLNLPPWVGGKGEWVSGLFEGGFKAGCMQMQVNVLDPAVLREARDYPERFPGLLVRVSGYSAYFNDLSPEMQLEVIERFATG